MNPSSSDLEHTRLDAPPDDPQPAPAATHEGEIHLGEADNHGVGAPAERLHARFNRYPGCQQLVVWLPRPGHEGYRSLRLVTDEGHVFLAEEVMSRLNGSVQMLFDTLEWPPGAYLLEVLHDEGWCHRLPMRKFAPGEAPPLAHVAPPTEAIEDEPEPIVYRDGFGRLMPNEDLILREKVLGELRVRLAECFAPRDPGDDEGRYR